MKLFVVTIILLGSSGLWSADIPHHFVRIADPALDEISGLAASVNHPGCYWVIEDSGGAAALYLLGDQGEVKATASLSGVENIDWEDLTQFTVDDESYLLIADTGDNRSKRKFATLHCVREPMIGKNQKTLEISTEWSIDFQFKGGPRDCEAVCVDRDAMKIYLISKRDKPPLIYQLPLNAPDNKTMPIAIKLGSLSPLKKLGRWIPFGTQPTSMAITTDGRVAVVLTYTTTYLFRRKESQSWAARFAEAPIALARHKLPQAEAVAFSTDDKSIMVTSEKPRPFLLTIPVP